MYQLNTRNKTKTKQKRKESKMKKILTVSLVAIMAVSAARADIASTEYVGKAVGASETTVKSYVDQKTADIATNTEVSAIKTTIQGYGDIVTRNAAEFATAAQGTKADSALQAADLADYAKTADVVTNEEMTAFEQTNTAAIGAAESAAKAYADSLAPNYATAAQGTKADSALQAADLADYAKTADVVTNEEMTAFEQTNTAAIGAAESAAKAYADSLAPNYATAAQGTKADSAAATVKSFIDAGVVIPAKPTDGKDYALVSGANGLEWQVIVYDLPAGEGNN